MCKVGAFYGRKIMNGERNIKTGESWKLTDVPSLWRGKTEAWLNQQSNKGVFDN